MASDNDIYSTFAAPLWRDVQNSDTFPEKRPLLAHYTSISNLEEIMARDEVWFSNPLYMNDVEEIRFVMLEGAQAFRQSECLRSVCGSSDRYFKLLHAFEFYFNEFSNKHVFDIYVFCLSEHDKDNTDGLLSMWRAYGSNGSGAAIVFDTAQATFLENSPLIISKVTYKSPDERRKWIDEKLVNLAELIKENDTPNDKLYLAASALFNRMKIFSIFTKHQGFIEEKEWRAVYLRERDLNKKMDDMLHYTVGKRGIEPKFKFKIKPIEGITKDDLSLEKIVSYIILGPSVSHPLSISAVQRMLEKVKKPTLASKLHASTIPFRPV